MKGGTVMGDEMAVCVPVGKAGLFVGDPVLSEVAVPGMFGLRSAGTQPRGRTSDTSTSRDDQLPTSQSRAKGLP